MAVREQRRALDQRVRAGAGLARGSVVDRIDRTVVLAAPALGGDLGGELVLSGTGGPGWDGLFSVWRGAPSRWGSQDGLLRRRGGFCLTPRGPRGPPHPKNPGVAPR